VEQRLIPALQFLQEVQRSPLRLPALIWQGWRQPLQPADAECLARLGLDKSSTWQERLYRALTIAALAQTSANRYL
jgi:hypothetical protein